MNDRSTPVSHRARDLAKNAVLALTAIALGLGAGLLINAANQAGHATPALTTPVVMIRFFGHVEAGGEINADQAVATLERVCRTPSVKRVILHLTSEGGSGTEAERIGTTIDRECRGKQVEALIDGRCLSACYQIAVHAPTIYANRHGFVGSIGTVATWIDYTAALAREGVVERVIASGPAKSGQYGQVMPSPEAQANLKEAMTDAGRAFALEVRTLRRGKVPAAAPIEEGGMYSTTRGLSYGLVDEVRTIDEVRALYAGQLTEIPEEATGRPRDGLPKTRAEQMMERAIERVANALK